MPRANRLRVEGGIFHLTHRCHSRAFLLKFGRDRDAYRRRMREKLQRFEVSLLDYCPTYCPTCEHVHLIVDALDRLQVSGFMREAGGEIPRESTLWEAIAWDEVKREAWWTESLTVGSLGLLEWTKPLNLSRQETKIVEQEPG